MHIWEWKKRSDKARDIGHAEKGASPANTSENSKSERRLVIFNSWGTERRDALERAHGASALFCCSLSLRSRDYPALEYKRACFATNTHSSCTVGHKSHDPWFHKKYMEAGVMTFVAHCTQNIEETRAYVGDQLISIPLGWLEHSRLLIYRSLSGRAFQRSFSVINKGFDA